MGRLDPLMPRLVESAAAMCKVHPQLHFIVNFYDSDPTPFDADALVRQHSRNSSCVEGTHVAGMKTVFWKRVITPELIRARNVELVWLVDSDIAIHPTAPSRSARSLVSWRAPMQHFCSHRSARSCMALTTASCV